MTLGERLKARRLELGIDQKTLAEYAGVARSVISRLEGGKAPNTTFQSICKITLALDMSMVEIYQLHVAIGEG